MEFGRGRVEGDADLGAGGVAGPLDRLQDHRQGRLVAAQRGREAALVADGRAQPALPQHGLQRPVHLGDDPQPLREARRSQGQ